MSEYEEWVTCQEAWLLVEQTKHVALLTEPYDMDRLRKQATILGRLEQQWAHRAGVPVEDAHASASKWLDEHPEQLADWERHLEGR